jgi:putative ATPase
MEVAYLRARKDALTTMAEPVPMVIRNAPTRLMKDLGYGDGYQYAHDVEGKVALTMQCLPDALQGTEYYTPTEEGREGLFKERLEYLKALRRQAN